MQNLHSFFCFCFFSDSWMYTGTRLMIDFFSPEFFWAEGNGCTQANKGLVCCCSCLAVSLCRYQCSDGEGRGGGMGKGAAFEHFRCPLSGEFDHKFCPTLRTLFWIWPCRGLGPKLVFQETPSWKISVSVKLAYINYYIFIMQYRYSVPSRIQYNVKFVWRIL